MLNNDHFGLHSFSVCLCHSACASPRPARPATLMSTQEHLLRSGRWWPVAAGQRDKHVVLKKERKTGIAEKEITPKMVNRPKTVTIIKLNLNNGSAPVEISPPTPSFPFVKTHEQIGSRAEDSNKRKGKWNGWGGIGCFPDTRVWPEMPLSCLSLDHIWLLRTSVVVNTAAAKLKAQLEHFSYFEKQQQSFQ